MLFGLSTGIVESMISEVAGTPNSLMLFDDWYSPLTILGYDQLDSVRPMLRVCVRVVRHEEEKIWLIIRQTV